MMTHRGKLFFIGGPSGGGKTTLMDDLLANDTSRVCVVKTTTRTPRKGEVEGKDYRFITEDEFKKQNSENKFLVPYRMYGNQYGTSRKEVEDALSSGHDVIMVGGGKVLPLIRKELPNEDIVGIYLMPHKDEEKSLDILASRMRKRGDSENNIEQRMKYMRENPPFSEDYKFDHVIHCFDEERNRVLSPQEVLEKAELIIATRHNKISFEHGTRSDIPDSLSIPSYKVIVGAKPERVVQSARGIRTAGSEAATIF